jgi:CDP-diacylglycerol--glycerol-3-phosphate 3-phosphatidyltransferase
MTIPNQLTVTRIILTPIFAFAFLSDSLILNHLSLIIFLIAALTDWYDGWLARKYNYISDLGKFLDPLADKILTSTAFLCFVFVDILNLWMVLIIVIRDLAITLLRIYGQSKKRLFATSYLAKVKTALQMIFLYYLLIAYIGFEKNLFGFESTEIIQILLNKDLINYSLIVITLLTVYTGVEYFYQNRFTLKELFK